jgi:hypothetical protein
MIASIVEQQTFIFPTGISVMADTITERGITSKHILSESSNRIHLFSNQT